MHDALTALHGRLDVVGVPDISLPRHDIQPAQAVLIAAGEVVQDCDLMPVRD